MHQESNQSSTRMSDRILGEMKKFMLICFVWKCILYFHIYTQVQLIISVNKTDFILFVKTLQVTLSVLTKEVEPDLFED